MTKTVPNSGLSYASVTFKRGQHFVHAKKIIFLPTSKNEVKSTGSPLQGHKGPDSALTLILHGVTPLISVASLLIYTRGKSGLSFLPVCEFYIKPISNKVQYCFLLLSMT